MASSLVQFRADDATKLQATVICSKLGMDLQSYLRMCLICLVNENGIPFSMHLDGEENEGIKALRRAQSAASAAGLEDYPMQAIDKEIAETRKSMKYKQ